MPSIRGGSDIVSCMKYLASEDAHFITGSNFVIDGGWTAARNYKREKHLAVGMLFHIHNWR